MPKFGPKSKAVRDTLHPELQAVVDEAIKHVDFSLIQGRRSNEEQAELYAIGRTVDVDKPTVTNTKPGDSTHNADPSDAFDFIPCPFTGWQDDAAFAHLAGIFRGIGILMGIEIRWGGDWDRDGTLVMRDPDESFKDLPHVERWY